MLEVGVVGCGEIAVERHIPAWIKCNKAKVVAVVDINEEKAKKVVRRFHIPRYYTDYYEMLEKEEGIFIVDICTPLGLHKEHAIEACKDGKHVLVEKPMAESAESCQEMIEASMHNKVMLSVFHTMREYPAVRLAKRWLDEGKIGTAHFLHFLTSYGELQPWVKSQGGVLWEVGIHRIYLTLYFLGKIRKVRAFSLDNRDLLETENIKIMTYAEQGVGEIHLMGTHGKIGEEKISIYGTKGEIFIPTVVFNTVVMRASSMKESWIDKFRKEILLDLRLSWGGVKRGVEYLLRGPALFPHATIINQFVDAINGKGNVPIPPEEGLEAVRVLQEIEKEFRSNIME